MEGSIKAETVNPNAKGTLKEWLEYTVAHIVIAQEIKVNEEEIAEMEHVVESADPVEE